MPFEIVRNDITKMAVDAIVNTANPRPVIGAGTDSAIHGAAGPGLLQARQKIGYLDMGQAAVTPAFNLQAKYVIHTVGPVWDGGSYAEEEYLRSCYKNSLRLALEYNCQSIAFPLISTGNYGFPKDKALQIAISAFSEFLLEHEIQLKYQCPRLDLKANALSRRLNAQMQELKDQYGVLLTRSRGSDGRQIRLEAVDDMYDNDDVSDIV